MSLLEDAATKESQTTFRKAGTYDTGTGSHTPTRGLRRFKKSQWWRNNYVCVLGVLLVIIILLGILVPILLSLKTKNKVQVDENLTIQSTESPLTEEGGGTKVDNEIAVAPNIEDDPIPPSEGNSSSINVVLLKTDGTNSTSTNSTRNNVTESVTTIRPTTISSVSMHPPVALCSNATAFRCIRSKKLVSKWRVCDGKEDCSDGSDEMGCEACLTSMSCKAKEDDESGDLSSAFHQGLTCVRGSSLCDDHVDCNNDQMEDELKYCWKEKCDENEYSCEGSKRCIPSDWLCDGERHCLNGDDEQNCHLVFKGTEKKCNGNALWCEADGSCIAAWNRCNGYPECGDGSDELDCGCDECRGDQIVLCSEPVGKCIPRTQLCDNNLNDCPNNQDEVNCPDCAMDETPSKLLCEDGKSYPLRWACSGLVNECNAFCTSCDPEIAFTCRNGHVKCVTRNRECDGSKDCDDGSDEENCECEEDSFKCPPDGFGDVNVTRCIDPSRRCDGYHDCIDGSDEKECLDGCKDFGAPDVTSVYCNSTRMCFPSTSRCDGIPDCPDFSDEDHCSCTACKSQLYSTYMCGSEGRCLTLGDVCNPRSPYHCPGTNTQDQQYCQKNFDPMFRKLSN